MTELHAAFSPSRYLIRRKVFKLFGGAFHIYAEDERTVCFYAEQKAFRFKEEFTVFGDEAMAQPLLRIQARQVLDLGATYDITDAVGGQKVGAVRRKALASILRDTWEVLDTNDNVVGTFGEDSNALLRRFIPLLLGHWHMEVGGSTVAKVDQVFRFFTKEFGLTISDNRKVDPRLAIGCAMLALMRELMREAR